MDALIKKFAEELSKTADWLRQEYDNISTGNITPAFLDGVKVSSYGSLQPVKALASISQEDPRTLLVTPWNKDDAYSIETAIRESGLPVSVSSFEGGVRVFVPALTEEDKKKLVKLIGAKREEARVSVRRHRNDLEKEIEGMDISEDEKKRLEKLMEEEVKKINEEIDGIFDAKEKSIMTV